MLVQSNRPVYLFMAILFILAVLLGQVTLWVGAVAMLACALTILVVMFWLSLIEFRSRRKLSPHGMPLYTIEDPHNRRKDIYIGLPDIHGNGFVLRKLTPELEAAIDVAEARKKQEDEEAYNRFAPPRVAMDGSEM